MTMLRHTLTLLTLLSLPFYVVRFTVFGLPTTLLELLLSLTIAIWAIQRFMLPLFSTPKTSWEETKTFLSILRSWYIEKRVFIKHLRGPVILFLVASVIAVDASPHVLPALGHWRAYILEPILFALVLIDTIQTERDRTHIIYALGGSLVIPVAIALYQQITGNFIPNAFWADAATRRVTSLYGYPNALGLYAVPVLILLLHEIKKILNQKTKLIALSVFFIATVAAITFTRSKGALLALAAGIAVYLFLNAKKKLLTAAILTIIAVIGIFALKDSLDLHGISTVQGGDSISVRLIQYQETWEMLKDRPLTGAGLRGYQTAMVPYHTQQHIEIFLYPHNIFLAMWSELGLLGLITFLLLLLSFFKHQYVNYCKAANVKSNESKFSHEDLSEPDPLGVSKLGAGAQRGGPAQREASSAEENLPLIATTIAAMVAILIHGLVDVPYFKNDLAILFWIICSLSLISLHRQNYNNMLQ